MKSRARWNPFSLDQWIAWIVATCAAGISITVYAYREFETKAEAAQVKLDMQREADFRWTEAKEQLHRIEQGVDEIKAARN